MVLTYFYLFIAVVLEAIATTALKLTEQFTKPVPIAVMVVCYAASFYFFTLVLKNIPLGITYALWSGLGLVLIIIIGAVRFKEIPDPRTISKIVLAKEKANVMLSYYSAKNRKTS